MPFWSIDLFACGDYSSDVQVLDHPTYKHLTKGGQAECMFNTDCIKKRALQIANT